MKNADEDAEIVKCEQEKDLGVNFDGKLTFEGHIAKAVKKAKSFLAIVRRSFKYLDKNSFLMLYKAIVRPHLEYGNLIWSPMHKKYSIALEKVQRRATKLIPELRHMS